MNSTLLNFVSNKSVWKLRAPPSTSFALLFSKILFSNVFASELGTVYIAPPFLKALLFIKVVLLNLLCLNVFLMYIAPPLKSAVLFMNSVLTNVFLSNWPI